MEVSYERTWRWYRDLAMTGALVVFNGVVAAWLFHLHYWAGCFNAAAAVYVARNFIRQARSKGPTKADLLKLIEETLAVARRAPADHITIEICQDLEEFQAAVKESKE
jgi:hypothetical protein